MRALAVSAPERLSGLYAQTPTWLEQSVDCMVGAWRGVTGARGITPPQIAFWEGVIAAAVRSEAWTAELARLYWTPTHVDGSKLRNHLMRERGEMETILKELGLLK